MQVQDQKIELQTKQATAMVNRTKAAMFAQSPDTFEVMMKSNENYANAIGIPYNSEALRAAYKDPDLRLSAQKEINKVLQGGISNNPQAIIEYFGQQSPEILSHLQDSSYTNSQTKNKQDQETKIHSMDNASRESSADKRLKMQLDAQNAKDKKDESKAARQETQKLSGALAKDGLPEVISSIKAIDKEVGGLYSDEAEAKFDKVASGKGWLASLKIPFTSIAPLESTSIADEDKPLYQAVASLRNSYLKLRSGGAVTDPEADRFLQELGQGNIRSGKQLQDGIQLLTSAVRSKAKTLESGYSPESVNIINERGNESGSASIPSPSGGKKALNAQVEAKIKKAKDLGYSDQEIQDYLNSTAGK